MPVKLGLNAKHLHFIALKAIAAYFKRAYLGVPNRLFCLAKQHVLQHTVVFNKCVLRI